MKIQTTKSFIDFILHKKKIEKLIDARSAVKLADAAFSGATFVSLGLATLHIYDGKFLKALPFLPLAYASYELKTVAQNAEKIMEAPPIKKIRSTWSMLFLNKKKWRFVTEGAPLSRALGLAYLTKYETQKKENRTLTKTLHVR